MAYNPGHKNLGQWTIGLIFIFLFIFITNFSYAGDHENSAFGIFSSHTVFYESYIGPERISIDEYFEWVNEQMEYLGAHWNRISGPFFWWISEPVLGEGYDLEQSCKILDSIFDPVNNLDSVLTLSAVGAPDGRNPIDDNLAWKQFVSTIAERYDGDETDDTYSNINVEYFQYMNEMHNWFGNGYSVEQYARTAKDTLDALRRANPNAKLVLVAHAGSTGSVDPRLKDIIIQLLNYDVEFPAVDMHYWGAADEWQHPEVIEIREYLDSLGLTGVQVWSMENGTWVGCPLDENGNSLPYQTEADQARSLVKRYAWARANGVTRLLWNNLLDFYNFRGDDTGIFNAMGMISDGLLICDPGDRGDRRLSYYTYALLSKNTNNCNASQVGDVDVPWDDVYAYTDNETGETLYIIWSENGDQPIRMQVNVTRVLVTDLITDNEGNVNQYEMTGGPRNPITLTLGENPILIRITGGT